MHRQQACSIYEDLNALPLALPVTAALPSRDMVCGSKSCSRQVERTNFYVGDTVRPLQQRTSLIKRMAPIDVCHTCRKCMRSKIDVQQTLRLAESVRCYLRRGPQCLFRTCELDMSHQLAIDQVQVTHYIHMRSSSIQLSRLQLSAKRYTFVGIRPHEMAHANLSTWAQPA
jgi:hypothetical protein